MSTNDQDLARIVSQAIPEDSQAPAFDKVWAGAERRYQNSRRRYAWLATAAGIAAAILIVFNAVTPSSIESDSIVMADLLESTSWVAPSDVLLPKHEIDLYQDLPAFSVSTRPAEGALL